MTVPVELQDHKQSLQDLVDILADAAGVEVDRQPRKPAQQTISSISNSEYSPESGPKPGGKRMFREMSTDDRKTPAAVPNSSQCPQLSPEDDQYIWKVYQASVLTDRSISRGRKSPEGMCAQIAKTLGVDWHLVSNRLQHLRVTQAQQQVNSHGHWTESDAETAPIGGDKGLPTPKTPVHLARKSSFSPADDELIWSTYVRDGCEVKTPQAYTELTTQLPSHLHSTVHYRLISLLEADQGVARNKVKRSLFGADEDEQILKAHRKNEQRTADSKLSEVELSTMLGKVLHREPARVLYRARKLFSERAGETSYAAWEERARNTPKVTVQHGSAWPYSADEDKLLLEVHRSSVGVHEKSRMFSSVAKGLNRSVGGLQLRLIRLRSIDHDDSLKRLQRPDCKEHDLTASGDVHDEGSSSVVKNVRRIGTSYTNTDTEDSAILKAYLSSELEHERTAALKCVAESIGRSAAAVQVHLERLLEKQSNLRRSSNSSEEEASSGNSLEGSTYSK